MKIDYEITVDVSNESGETKKKVQDAFFKLGIMWWGVSTRYNHLSFANIYSNAFDDGVLSNNLLYAEYYREPTHTIEELFKLAGMEDEMIVKTNLKQFDLEKALSGDPVVTRDGLEVTQVTLFECEGQLPVMAVIAGELEGFTKTGEYFPTGEASGFDLFMKPKTHNINGFEVPAPIDRELVVGECVYIASPTYPDFYHEAKVSKSNLWSQLMQERGLAYSSKEGAIANAKAMLGINPYEDK